MEEFLILVFQFIFEVVLQVLAELPFDLFVGSREFKRDQSSKGFEWIFVSLVMGGAVGAISLFVRPNTLLKSGTARIAYLILAPLLSAWFSFVLARLLAGRGRSWIIPKRHAICAFCFALVLTVVRFTYAQRPA
jgi:hypothetical protein